MKPIFTIRPNRKIETEYDKMMADQRAELASGKISIRWSQSHAGYRIRAGRNALLGVETFISESDAKTWLAENHGITI